MTIPISRRFISIALYSSVMLFVASCNNTDKFDKNRLRVIGLFLLHYYDENGQWPRNFSEVRFDNSSIEARLLSGTITGYVINEHSREGLILVQRLPGDDHVMVMSKGGFRVGNAQQEFENLSGGRKISWNDGHISAPKSNSQ